MYVLTITGDCDVFKKVFRYYRTMVVKVRWPIEYLQLNKDFLVKISPNLLIDIKMVQR